MEFLLHTAGTKGTAKKKDKKKISFKREIKKGKSIRN